MLLKETLLVRNALNEDLFRYDASELMERRIGADHLLYALKKYISLGSEFINEVTEELDSKASTNNLYSIPSFRIKEMKFRRVNFKFNFLTFNNG